MPWTLMSTNHGTLPGFISVTHLARTRIGKPLFFAVGAISGRFTVRHAQLRPSTNGRVKVIDELTPSDPLRLALDGSGEMLRDSMSVAGHAGIEDDLEYS
jgi:hypothetical protein